ncbi:carbohydrate sulfotransferase 1-like [Glandiceps talaboti]
MKFNRRLFNFAVLITFGVLVLPWFVRWYRDYTRTHAWVKIADWKQYCPVIPTTLQNRDSILTPNSTVGGEIKNNSRSVNRTLQTNILILAGARTGSSFVGEFLKSNPNIFYVFEPLRYIHKLYDIELEPEMSIKGVQHLSQIYRCKSGHKKLKKYGSVGRGCEKGVSNIATKVVRLVDIRDVVSLMQDPDVQLKVINVVRDPRAMMASIIPMYLMEWKLGYVESNAKVLKVQDLKEPALERLKQYCDAGMWNFLIKTSEEDKSPWKQNYLVVRFEDIAMEPLYYAEKIYNFIGIDFHSNVLQWIENNTRSNTVFGGYGVSRNSSAVVGNWKNRMTFDLVEKIQNARMCRKFMLALNYTIARNETHFSELTSFFTPVDNQIMGFS